MTLANKIAFVLLCAAIIFTTVVYGAVHQPVIALVYVMFGGMLVLWAIDGYITGSMRFSSSHLQIPIILTVVYGVIQIIPFGTITETGGIQGISRTISLDPFSTQATVIHLLGLFLFFAVSLTLIDSASRLRKLVIVITVFGFIFAFYAILQAVLSPDKIYGIYERREVAPFGSFVNRHNFAAYMEMTLSLPMGLLFVGAIAKDKRLLYFTAIGLMGVALLLSGSRGGFVAFLAEVIFLFILTTPARSGRKLYLKLGLVVVLVAAIIGGSFFVGGESSLTRIAETSGSQNVTSDRSHIWSVTLRVIANSFPLGAGLGSFGAAYTAFDTRSGAERVEQAHNDYLQIAADAGIIGILLGLFFVFTLFRVGIKAAKSDNTYRRGVAVGALAGCFAILIHSIFDFVLHTTAITVLFLTLVTLIVASRNRYEDDIEELEGRKIKRKRSSSVASISSAKRNSLP
ncbi:MAG: O-antigen ligase family protein [Saprospiraceae bacterium]|nr:O-antigen ligase family protein [Pyrinomonadaceae bacterium]